MREVILTDEQGTPTGTMEIMKAHTGEGALHKAFSVFVFKENGRDILLQQRSTQKMLFPLIWANTCCSHPRPGEDYQAAAEKRLKEECGFTCTLTEGPSFVYKAFDPEGRGVEHEHDTIFLGEVPAGIPLNPDPNEVASLQWVPVQQLIADIRARPDRYAPWLKIAIELLNPAHE